MKRICTMPLVEPTVGSPVVWRRQHLLQCRWQRGTIKEVIDCVGTAIKVQPKHPLHRAKWMRLYDLFQEAK